MIYKIIDWIDRMFPESGNRAIDKLLIFVGRSYSVRALSLEKDKTKTKKLSKIRKVCVIYDVNIGDLVILGPAATEISGILGPEARIDCIAGKKAAELVREIPGVTEIFPVYRHVPYPSAEEVEKINEIISAEKYDLIFNFSPFIKNKDLESGRTPVIDFRGLVPVLAEILSDPNKVGHISFGFTAFIREIFGQAGEPRRTNSAKPILVIQKEAVREAEEFLQKSHVRREKPLIIFNLATASRFTEIPESLKKSLLGGLSELPATVLIYPDKSFSEGDPSENIKMIPKNFSLPAFAALCDKAEFFLTGDTGSMHIAAAQKFFSGAETPARNRTAVFSIFGATPARLYGYDSIRPGFLPADQDAVSRVYMKDTGCPSLFYMNKNSIRHDKAEDFFKGIEAEKIISDIRSLL